MTSFSAERRFASHVRLARFGAKNSLARAIRKYGADSCTVRTLLVGSRDYCANLERAAIVAFGTRGPHGYNEADGGQGCLLSGDALARRNKSISAAHSTEESRAIFRERGLKMWRDEEFRAKQSTSIQAALAKPETKERLSAAQKLLWADPAEREKRTSGISQAFANPETKAKLIAAQKRGNADPAVKARKSEIMRQRMADPEVKRKTVERMLAARGIAMKEQP